MNDTGLFPGYIPRDEERRILGEVAKVRADGQSRVVLLYGPGGVGKTSLMHRLPSASEAIQGAVWIEPVDIDDSDYWLLSNLEQHIVSHLDPDGSYFEPYLDYLSRLPGYTLPRIDYETVVSHLARIKQAFAECYRRFTADTGKTVVISLDTVEAIRGMYLLVTLTQWMKALPATLFVLSGRPPRGGNGNDRIKSELEGSHLPLPVTTIPLGDFTWEAATEYLRGSGIASGLTQEEIDKLLHLTRGHPLWLAFTVDYLARQGVPDEAAGNSLNFIKRELPYGEDVTLTGHFLLETFKRRLVAPYHDTDFWHESIQRLAVVRESIERPVWCQLMADRPLPSDVPDMDHAWDQLVQIPWIRSGMNRRSVALHDAVAEELAQRIIPLHDQDRQWRRRLWRRAEQIYRELSESREAELEQQVSSLEEDLQTLSVTAELGGQDRPASPEESGIIAKAAALEPQQRELSQLKSIRLYYELLSDFAVGCRQFLELLESANARHDLLSQDLLSAEIQRFLPRGAQAYALSDAVGEVIEDFRAWLTSSEGRGLHLEIGLSLADYLTKSDQQEAAFALLAELPASLDPRTRYHLSNLRGNACMRIPQRVKEGLTYFRQALAEAEALESEDRLRIIAQAHKELGFYYRNVGKWEDADASYQRARDALSQTLLTGGTADEREEMASIQTNWAYVKGLSGDYREGASLVESAIAVRRRLGNLQQEGVSWSVCGEVYRYERRFQRAWDAYAKAVEIFQAMRNWSWLGLVYQEQAICLFQATQEGTQLVVGARDEAKRLITVALDLCRDLSLRGYPSALNRAGRIYGDENADVALAYLEEGIEWARTLSDGWFWFANLIEYAELCYRAWAKTGGQGYYDRIWTHEGDIAQAMEGYGFLYLKGRWELLQGHLDIRRVISAGEQRRLGSALDHYQQGFSLIVQGHMGSSGVPAVENEFKTFVDLVQQLPASVRQEWQSQLRRAWSQQSGRTLLLARLEEIY
jgi:tetratricopeptide (TPR) repeat protein